MASVVCVILVQGLIVTAYPTGEDRVSMELPVAGLTEFSGTAPAKGSVALLGHAPGPDLILPFDFTPSDPVTPILHQDVLERKDSIVFRGTADTYPPIHIERDNEDGSNDEVPKKVVLGALLAESIMAAKGADIDAKLAEIEEFVETELEVLGPIIRNALTNVDTSTVDSSVVSVIQEMETEISSDLTMLNEFVEAELLKTEDLVEAVIKSVEEATAKNPKYGLAAQKELANKNAMIQKELSTLETFVDAKLAKSDALVETELDKVRIFVEKELGKIDSIVETELAMVDSLVEKELSKTDAVVKSELSKIESTVGSKLAKVGTAIDRVADLDTGNSDHILSVLNFETVQPEYEDTEPKTVHIDGTFPVSGRTLIFGNTGYISPVSAGAPLPLHVESFPVFETTDFVDTYEPEFGPGDVLYEYDDGSILVLPFEEEPAFSELPAVDYSRFLNTPCSPLPSVTGTFTPPMVGQAKPFVPLKPMTQPYHQPYFTISENEDSPAAEPVLYHRKQLPVVNILKNRLKLIHKPTSAIVAGDVEFSGTVEAAGSTGIVADFSCPPLTATEEGPDGKKYIWISKKSTEKDHPKPELNPGPSCSDFSNKFSLDTNCQGPGLDVDFGLLGSLPVGDSFIG